MKNCDEKTNWMSALQLLNIIGPENISMEGFLGGFKHYKSNKS